MLDLIRIKTTALFIKQINIYSTDCVWGGGEEGHNTYFWQN